MTSLRWFAGRCWVLPVQLRLVRQWIHVWRCLVCFCGALYLAATRLMLVLPEEHRHCFFWETTSGFFLYSTLLGSTVDTYFCQSTEAWGFHAFRCVKVDLGSRGRFCLVLVAVGRISHIFNEGGHAHASIYGRISHIFPMMVDSDPDGELADEWQSRVFCFIFRTPSAWT